MFLGFLLLHQIKKLTNAITSMTSTKVKPLFCFISNDFPPCLFLWGGGGLMFKFKYTHLFKLLNFKHELIINDFYWFDNKKYYFT